MESFIPGSRDVSAPWDGWALTTPSSCLRATGGSTGVQAARGKAMGQCHGGWPRTTITEFMGGGADADIWRRQGLKPLGGSQRKGVKGCAGINRISLQFFFSVHSNINLNTQQRNTIRRIYLTYLSLLFCCYWFGLGFFPARCFHNKKIETSEWKLQEILLKPDEVFEFSSIAQISITSTHFTEWIRRSTECVQVSASQKIIGILKCFGHLQLPA